MNRVLSYLSRGTKYCSLVFAMVSPTPSWWLSMRAFSTSFSRPHFLVGKLGNPPGFYLCTGKSLLVSLQFSCSWPSLNCFFASGLYPFHPELDLFASLFYGERSRGLLYFSGCFWCFAWLTIPMQRSWLLFRDPTCPWAGLTHLKLVVLPWIFPRGFSLLPLFPLLRFLWCQVGSSLVLITIMVPATRVWTFGLRQYLGF